MAGLGKGMTAHSSILAWRIPWTEESGGLQSMGSQRVGRDLATEHVWVHTHTETHCTWEGHGLLIKSLISRTTGFCLLLSLSGKWAGKESKVGSGKQAGEASEDKCNSEINRRCPLAIN